MRKKQGAPMSEAVLSLIREEVAARGWGEAEFVWAMKASPRLARAVLAGHASMSRLMAYRLAIAFGTGDAVWLNLQSVKRFAGTPTG